MKITALIAEDEPLLAANLQAELAQIWPDLIICANVGDGDSAVELAKSQQPDVLFLDISMPGMTGIEVAQALGEDWPETGKPFPLIVFVTAYDQYAVQAFERAAFDYIMKPLQTARLAQTCERLQATLRQRVQAPTTEPALGPVIEQLRGLLGISNPGLPAIGTSTEFLRMIQVGSGNVISMVRMQDVLYFEAADKYVRVITAQGEHLIRMSLRELQQQIDPRSFWQIHRGTIVRSDAIVSALRHESGKLTLTLNGHHDKLTVSRLYAHLFKGM